MVTMLPGTQDRATRSSNEASERRWQIVCARQTNPSFFYAVATTGIYCKPGCASRLPLRENVRFFRTAALAQAAGFRACRRCCPASAMPALDRAAEAVITACRWMEQHAEEPVSYTTLATRAGMGASHFHRTFKRITGLTPKRFADDLRTRSFKAGLKRGRTVTDQLYASGYGSSSRLYNRSDAALGMTPNDYRSGGADRFIHYAAFDTALGQMLLGATERGICFLQFGTGFEELLAVLQKEFPQAMLQPAPPHPHYLEWIAAIRAYVQHSEIPTALPLDLRATLFQVRVWDYLQTIPAGESRSYAQAAAELGMPTATRAVASACARNRVALLVPCHRVLRGDGTLGGYRWGLERKAELLRKEAAARRGLQTPGSPSKP